MISTQKCDVCRVSKFRNRSINHIDTTNLRKFLKEISGGKNNEKPRINIHWKAHQVNMIMEGIATKTYDTNPWRKQVNYDA